MITYYEGEQFEDIFGDGEYLISNHGRVYSTITRKFLRQQINDNGYKRVRIKKHGAFYIHRLVAENFLRLPTNKGDVNLLVVDHINGDRLNNNVFNLRWITSRENSLNRSVNR